MELIAIRDSLAGCQRRLRMLELHPQAKRE
jgi:hypothetical protein